MSNMRKGRMSLILFVWNSPSLLLFDVLDAAFLGR
jgi:hypothetical protein